MEWIRKVYDPLIIAGKEDRWNIWQAEMAVGIMQEAPAIDVSSSFSTLLFFVASFTFSPPPPRCAA
jgi:hypothetical protein